MRQVIAAMMTVDAEWLGSQWCERLDASVWAPRLAKDGARSELVAALLEHYRDAISRDYWRAIRTPEDGTDGWISGSNNPRVETVCRIEVLSVGREVIEAYLNSKAFPRLKLDEQGQEEILDDLDMAYRLLTHKQIQHVCEWFLHATRPGPPVVPSQDSRMPSRQGH